MSQATLGPVEALLGDAWRAVAGVHDGTVASYPRTGEGKTRPRSG